MTAKRTSGIERRRRAALRDGNEAYSARRTEIVRVGAEVFREFGYDAASLKDVSARLGTDRATLYYYFSSKGELFHEVTEAAVQEVVQTAERIAESGGSPASRLSDLIVATMTAYERHYPYLFAYIQEDMVRVQADADNEKWAKRMVNFGTRFERAVISIIEQGQADGSFNGENPRIVAYGVIGAINWTHRWFHPSGLVPADEIGRTFARLTLRGLERPS